MISKLERRFTIVALLVIMAVLMILLVAVNIFSINVNIKRADSSLERLYASTSGNFKLTDKFDDPPPVNLNQPPIEKEHNRAFEIVVNNDGEIIRYNGSINMLSDDLVIELTDTVLANNRQKGFEEGFRYLLVEETNKKRIFFLDYSFEKRSETTFLWGSVLVFMIISALVAVLVRILLKPVMKPIKEAYEKQKRFVTDASHEIRTPLTIISTDIQLIEMEGGTNEWTHSIQNQVKRLESLSSDLVSLSRLDELGLMMEQESVNLSDIVNDVVMGFEPAIVAEEKTLITQIDDDIVLEGHYDSLEKVVSTLMHNALKYSSKKGQIEVFLKAENKKIRMRVKNTCDQIEKGDHKEYFERFYRAEESRNSQTGGFGIGLAIAKSIVEEHQGHIEAYSDNGKNLAINIQFRAKIK